MYLLVGGPLFVKLFREVTCLTHDFCLHSVGVKSELDTKFAVEVNEGICWLVFSGFDRVLSADF